jgi:hypothetical protein
MRYSDHFLSNKYWKCVERIDKLKTEVCNPYFKKHPDSWYFTRINSLEQKCKWCLRVDRHQQGLPLREDFL